MVESFTFTKAIWDAMKYFPEDMQRNFINAIMGYMFDDISPDDIDITVRGIFELIRPTLDVSKKRSHATAKKRASRSAAEESNSDLSEEKNDLESESEKSNLSLEEVESDSDSAAEELKFGLNSIKTKCDSESEKSNSDLIYIKKDFDFESEKSNSDLIRIKNKLDSEAEKSKSRSIFTQEKEVSKKENNYEENNKYIYMVVKEGDCKGERRRTGPKSITGEKKSDNAGKSSMEKPLDGIGEYGWVKLSFSELVSLRETYGSDVAADYIARLDEYMQNTPEARKKYNSHFVTIKSWIRKDKAVSISRGRASPQKSAKNGFSNFDYKEMTDEESRALERRLLKKSKEPVNVDELRKRMKEM